MVSTRLRIIPSVRGALVGADAVATAAARRAPFVPPATALRGVLHAVRHVASAITGVGAIATAAAHRDARLILSDLPHWGRDADAMRPH